MKVAQNYILLKNDHQQGSRVLYLTNSIRSEDTINIQELLLQGLSLKYLLNMNICLKFIWSHSLLPKTKMFHVSNTPLRVTVNIADLYLQSLAFQ